ncbi:acid protease [Astrocystis sublimbata]|nr:acid protease [Astrocystis sublimbata]
MFPQAGLALLTASAAVAATTGNRPKPGLPSLFPRLDAKKTRSSQEPAPPTVYFPLNFRYGSDQKITTDLVIPGTNKTMPVCFDQGSESFWILGPGALYNWGSEALPAPGRPGPCNTSATPVYEYSASPDADTAPFPYINAYAGFSKIVSGDSVVDDTMTFTSVAGQKSSIADIRAALVDFYMVRYPDFSGQCDPAGLTYDVGILGTAPFHYNNDYKSSEPHLRQELLEQGTIKAPVQSMWMDKRPQGIEDTYTGGAIFGGIDLSKFTGPLVKVRSLQDDDTLGYNVAQPVLSIRGKKIKTDASAGACFVDSGTRNDELPVAYADTEEFYETTGLVESPEGYVSWPGACESVPSNVTLDMKFPGATNGTFVDIKVPLKNYVRWDSGEEGLCRLNINLGECTLAAPFSTAAFFAADDERGEVAFAQGGISERGSEPSEDSIVLRIP